MKTLRFLAAAKATSLALLAGPAIAAGAPAAKPAPAPQPPAGVYSIDKPHTSVTFRVSHLGFSHYTARFANIDGRLKFDPAHPADMSVEATIAPQSLALNAPPAGFHDQLMGKNFFDAARFPSITFKSSKVQVVGKNTAKVTGNLTLHGVTKPVSLEVTFKPQGGGASLDVSGTVKRLDFGVGTGDYADTSVIGADVKIKAHLQLAPK
jgi:polyisoprenoid-binding protein YceI